MAGIEVSSSVLRPMVSARVIQYAEAVSLLVLGEGRVKVGDSRECVCGCDPVRGGGESAVASIWRGNWSGGTRQRSVEKAFDVGGELILEGRQLLAENRFEMLEAIRGRAHAPEVVDDR